MNLYSFLIVLFSVCAYFTSLDSNIDDSGIATHDVKMFEQQERFIFSKAPYSIALAGIGGGKTKGGAIKAMFMCFMYPEKIGLILANTVRQLEDYTLDTFLKTLDEHEVNYYRKKSERKVFVEVSADVWAEIHYRSIDNYNNIRGGEYFWIWMDEARDYDEEAFDVILGRVGREKSKDQQQIFITTTPLGEDWVNDRFIDTESGMYLTGQVDLIQWTTMDNPYINPDYVKKLAIAYDQDTFDQEVLGKIISTTKGAIYSQFASHMHVLNDEDVEYDPNRPLIWCIDFNSDPFCTVIVQQHGEITYVIDEIILEPGTCYDIVQEMKRRYPPENHYSSLHVYGDASGRFGKNRQTRISDWAAIEKALNEGEGEGEGEEKYRVIYKIKKANPRRLERYRAVNSRFLNSVQQKRLYILQKCKYTISDCKKLKKLKGTHDVDESLLKRDRTIGHCMDALGYFIHFVFPVKKFESLRAVKRKG